MNNPLFTFSSCVSVAASWKRYIFSLRSSVPRHTSAKMSTSSPSTTSTRRLTEARLIVVTNLRYLFCCSGWVFLIPARLAVLGDLPIIPRPLLPDLRLATTRMSVNRKSVSSYPLPHKVSPVAATSITSLRQTKLYYNGILKRNVINFKGLLDMKIPSYPKARPNFGRIVFFYSPFMLLLASQNYPVTLPPVRIDNACWAVLYFIVNVKNCNLAFSFSFIFVDVSQNLLIAICTSIQTVMVAGYGELTSLILARAASNSATSG